VETSDVVHLEGRRKTLLRWSGERGSEVSRDASVDVGEMRKEMREAGVHVEVLEEKGGRVGNQLDPSCVRAGRRADQTGLTGGTDK